MKELKELIFVAKRKLQYDKRNSWYSGPETYLLALKSEIDEVLKEIPLKRIRYLEDELADVLWDYLNAVIGFEEHTGVTFESIVVRARRKYETRVTAIENGEEWEAVKLRQQQELAIEQEQLEHAS